MKKLYTLIMIMLIGITAIVSMNKGVRAEFESDVSDRGNGEDYAWITAVYSDNIVPTPNDIFIITYKIHGEEETAQITVDASDLVDNRMKIELPAHTYEITAIQYEGANKGISAYGINSVFNTDNERRDTLFISVGIEKTQELYEKFSVQNCVRGVINARDLSADPSNTKTLPDAIAERVEEENRLQTEYFNGLGSTEREEVTTIQNNDTYDANDNYDEEYGVEQQVPSGDEPQIEIYETTTEETTEAENKKEDKQSFVDILTKIIVTFVIVVAILSLVAFVIVKKRNSDY